MAASISTASSAFAAARCASGARRPSRSNPGPVASTSAIARRRRIIKSEYPDADAAAAARASSRRRRPPPRVVRVLPRATVGPAVTTREENGSVDEDEDEDEDTAWNMDNAVCMDAEDLERLTRVSSDSFAYSYGQSARKLPKRIVLVRHGESYGNVDESEYTRTPDSQIRLTTNGHAQATETGKQLRKLFDEDFVVDDDGEVSAADSAKSLHPYRVFFYISPYRRSKETALGIARAFDDDAISGVREEPQLREQDFGNFQDASRKKLEKRERQYFGRFFYRFPDGESGADVFDRITIFEDHMVRDIDAGRFDENTNMVLCTHGLTLRLFLMRWFHWTVAEYERIANPANSTPIILERIDDPTVNKGTFHTKELYRLSAESMKGLRGISDVMARCVLYTGPHTTPFAW